MAGTNRRESIGVDRRASTRSSVQQQNDDDYDYDLEAMGISDGFRPGGVGMGHTRMSSQTMQSTQTAGRRTPPPRPSSTTKPNNVDSFALRHDGDMGDLRRNSSIASAVNPALPTRSSSVSTDVPYVRAESPYRGPAGPSHPYQMYPQESRLARTASMATTSTAPMTERSYAGPSGPTHPYGMYPQNIVPEESTDTLTPAASVPVGFPGLNNNYQRRLGPDGEEIADIIGPDGHTEQLPPYTQYPDEALARKTRPTVAVPTAEPTAVTVAAPVAGAGGIGLATRNPEFASQENLNSPQSRRSVMSESSSHQVNTAAMDISEKPELKKWQRIAKRKLCGIVPIWVLVLVAAVLIIFVIILATVLAVLKHGPPPKHQQQDPHESGQAQSEVYYTTMTTTFDATPISAIPTGVSSLPTGTFALPVNIPSGTQKSCLVNSAQSNAWSCIVSPNPSPLQLLITPLSDATSPFKNNGLVMTYGNDTMVSWTYGAQAPVMTDQQVMKLVTDSEEPDRGPAWWFQHLYNKLVVLRESDITMPASKRDVAERQAPGPGPDPGPGQGNGNFHDTGDFTGRKGVAQPGDKPWFCYWNNTLLEAFIYVNQTSSSGVQPASSAPAFTPTATTPSNSQQAAGTYRSSVPTSNVQSSSSSYSGQSQQPHFLPTYPRVVKLEERRVPNGVQPYCVQYIVQQDGSAIPSMNSTNQPVTLVLNETIPTMFSRRDFLEQSLYERDDADQCGCSWEWT
ncbi:hypothetical protein LOCC1_G000001 [Lachnellula occidentalis]|uniref:DUF7820 domain-containing protein n=1 Tax=Lachnellula occidentalis TaxID=215460 RepID=A0A8H8S7U8_9HELO|nr:hypothetical protein LOCC1_G000001 [Lachnellula occidentalis]